MQNQLNEEDFLQPEFYNPWKRFIVFYGIAFLNMILMYFTLEKASFESALTLEIIIILLSALLFLVIPFIMVLHTPKSIYIKKSNIYVGISFLMVSYTLSFHVLDFNNNPYYLWELGSRIPYTLRNLAILILYGFICSYLITVINKRRLKKLKAFEINN